MKNECALAPNSQRRVRETQATTQVAMLSNKYISVYTLIMIFINKVCNALAQQKVRYAIVGGYAVALHGAVRGTMDVDIAIDWDLSTLRRTEKVLKKLGLVSRLPISANDVFQFRDEYITNRNLVAWNFYNPEDVSQLIDIIITYDLKNKGRQRLHTAAGPIHVLQLDELIRMKRASGRPQDIEDADALEKLK